MVKRDITLITLVVLLVLLLSVFVFAQVSPSISTDKADYAPGETVLISGEGFNSDSDLSVSITRPDSVVESCDTGSCDARFLDGALTSDSLSAFSDYGYELNGIEGEYSVDVSDGENSAQTTFTDSGIDTECESFGFDFGVNKWQCDVDWVLDEGGDVGTSVTGTCTDADWDVGDSGAEGIVVKGGAFEDYSVTGTGGNEVTATDISHITFCGNDPVCGDHEVEGGEECDDGNTESGDVCSAECLIEFCGDNMVNNIDEECDDGANGDDTDSCTDQCTLTFCGDGTIQDPNGYDVNEQCDDGNTEDNDYCSYTCQIEECISDADCSNLNEPLCQVGVCNLDTNTCEASFEDDDGGPDILDLKVSKIPEQCKITINTTAQDQCSPVIDGEYFFGGGTCGAKGTGEEFDSLTPVDLNDLIAELIENGAIVNDGSLNVHVRAKDEAGNWGGCETTNIQLDCLPPEYPTCDLGNTDYNGAPDGIILNDGSGDMCNPQEKLVCGNNVTIKANICDSQSRIQLAEYFLDDMPLLNWLGINMSATDGIFDEKCEDVNATINTTGLFEGTHFVTLHGKDGQENWGKFSPFINVSFIKDTTPPKTDKEITFADEESVGCDPNNFNYPQGINSEDVENGCYYVKPGTKITLSANDFNPDNGENDGFNNLPGEYAQNTTIHYNLWYSQDCTVNEPVWELKAENVQGLLDQDVMITLEKDSCHLIEYWATDLVCGNEEQHHFELDIVDSKPPVTEKTVSDPKVSGDENPIHYYITDDTTITLDCSDQDPHPVDDVTLHWELFYNGESEDCDGLTDNEWGDPIQSGWEDGGYVEIFDLDDSCHKLEYFCEDALGNAELLQTEIDAVDNTPPEITKEVIGPQTGQCPPEPLYYGNNEEYIGEEQYKNHEGQCFIDNATIIDVIATDPQPHPADDVSCYYWYFVFEDEYGETGERFPSSGVFRTFPIQFPEESIHELHLVCEDALGNEVRDVEEFIVDHTPPKTEKEFGEPIFTYYDLCVEVAEEECGYEEEGNCVDEKVQECLENSGGLNQENLYTPIWINNETPIWLNSEDQEPHPSGVDELFYRVTLVDDEACESIVRCEETSGSGEWTPSESNEAHFEIEEESCHLIEYYAIDNVEKNETVNKQCVFVDNTPPETDKSVGEPRFDCTSDDPEQCGFESVPEEKWKSLYVTSETPINLSCNDPEPHPVDHEELCFAVSWHVTEGECNEEYGYWDGEICWLTEKYGSYYGKEEVIDDYYCVDLNENNEFEFFFLEESLHNLEWFCRDSLWNEGELNIEWDNVDDTPPEIIVHNPNPEEAKNVTRCTQAIVAEIIDKKSGVNESTIYAELVNNTGETEIILEVIDLTKSIYGTWEGLMSKEHPVGKYLLRVCAEDNLGNKDCKEIEENLMETLVVEFIHPSECVVDPETGGECGFSFNVCMRGGNNAKFWLDKLGGVITPGMMNATIIDPDTNESAFVGLRHEQPYDNQESCEEAGYVWEDDACWFISDVEMLLLGQQCIDIIGKENFDLNLLITNLTAQTIGPGIHDLNYWIETSLMCEIE